MRILFCTDTWPPQVNGVSVVTALSVRGLAARGWDCEVVAPRYPSDTDGLTLDDGGVRVTTIPSVPLPVYKEIRLAAPAWRTVREVVERFKPDLVHCATEFVVGRLGRRAARAAGIPWTTSYHTDFARYAEAYGLPWLRAPLARSIARFHASAQRTYTPGAPAREDLAALGVPNVEVWGRGVDTTQFHPGKRALAAQEGFHPGTAFTFVHVSRLAPEKNVACLLDAFAEVQRTTDRSVRFIVAGTGPSLPELRARATEGVTFLGTLDRDRTLPALYASADGFLFASTTETLGLVVLEAMASGLPVIATAAGGVADHLRDGENGLAFPAGDATACAAAMRRLMQDHELRDRLRIGARATAEARGWDAELDRLDVSYREVLRSRRAT